MSSTVIHRFYTGIGSRKVPNSIKSCIVELAETLNLLVNIMNKLILVMLMLISTTAISAGDAYKQTIRLTQRDFEIANEVCQDHGGVSSITPEIVRVTDLHYTVLQLYIDCVENFSYKKYLNEIRR